MVRTNKNESALYALQGVLICARDLALRCAREGSSNDLQTLVEMLDRAEYLPFLLASADDQTVQFRGILREIARRHGGDFILRRFDEAAPVGWKPSRNDFPEK